jgi:hypothetical protein
MIRPARRSFRSVQFGGVIDGSFADCLQTHNLHSPVVVLPRGACPIEHGHPHAHRRCRPSLRTAVRSTLLRFQSTSSLAAPRASRISSSRTRCCLAWHCGLPDRCPEDSEEVACTCSRDLGGRGGRTTADRADVHATYTLPAAGFGAFRTREECAAAA